MGSFERSGNIWLERTGLACILLLALILRTQYLEQISFWFDEACSWKVSQFPWSDMWDAISRDAHPPLFYILLKGWMSLFGNSVVSARLFSVTFGTLTVAMTWVFMHVALKSLHGDHPGRFRAAPLMAAMFVALSPLHVELSLEARPYTLGTFLALALATSAIGVFARPSSSLSWLCFAMSSVALSMTHYYGALTVVAIWLACGLEAISRIAANDGHSVARKFYLGFGLSGLLMMVVWMPWFSTFSFQLSRANRQLWLSELNSHGLAEMLWQSLAGGKHSDTWNIWIWGASAIWCLAAFGLLARWIRKPQLTYLLILSGMLFPVLVSISYSVAVRSILAVKYLTFAQLFLLLGLALLLDFTDRGIRNVKWGFQIVGFLAVASWLSYWTGDFQTRRHDIAQHPGMRGAIAFLNERREPGELCVVASPFVHTLASVYADDVENLKTVFIGDPRRSLLSGPALRDADVIDFDEVPEDATVVWTIDVDKLFGREFSYQLPQQYQLTAHESFVERFGYLLNIHVRRYERRE